MLLIILIPVVFFVGQLLILRLYGFDSLIPDYVFYCSVLDLICTVVLFLLVAILYRVTIRNYFYLWQQSYSNSSDYYPLVFLGFLFFFLALVNSIDMINLILSGVGRQQIFDDFGGVPFWLSLSDKFFLVSSIFILFTSAPRWVKGLFLIGFIFTTIVMTSRANLMFFLIVLSIMLMLDFSFSKLKILIVLIVVFVALAGFQGVYLQHREAEAVFLPGLKPVEDLFLYRSYSLYLAQVSVQFSADHSKFAYPFLGYLSEYIARYFAVGPFVDSNFVMQFHSFTSEIRQHSANVLYPWWSWFYGAYGYGGLLLKLIFNFVLLYVSLIFRLYPVFVLFVYWVLIAGATKHPLLTLDAYFMLFFVFVLSLMSKVKLIPRREYGDY